MGSMRANASVVIRRCRGRSYHHVPPSRRSASVRAPGLTMRLSLRTLPLHFWSGARNLPLQLLELSLDLCFGPRCVMRLPVIHLLGCDRARLLRFVIPLHHHRVRLVDAEQRTLQGEPLVGTAIHSLPEMHLHPCGTLHVLDESTVLSDQRAHLFSGQVTRDLMLQIGSRPWKFFDRLRDELIHVFVGLALLVVVPLVPSALALPALMVRVFSVPAALPLRSPSGVRRIRSTMAIHGAG
mmetsp:Transcript_69539/g.193489  ORF Transcript_69539/g.193489 Transcript_69539/m.193489 type:complete len:239 (+) Transcript_69539:53-769(+)